MEKHGDADNVEKQCDGRGEATESKFAVTSVTPERMIQLADAVNGDGDPHEVADECRVGVKKFTGNLREMAVKTRPQGDELRLVHVDSIRQNEA